MQKLMKDIKHNIRPTHIIVEDGICQSIENYKNRCPYSDGCFCNPFQRKECTDWKKNYPFFRKEPLIKSMIKERLLHKVMFSPGRKLNVWFKVKNIFLDECCVMTSISATNIKYFGNNFKEYFGNNFKILWKYEQKKLRDRGLQDFLKTMSLPSTDVLLINEMPNDSILEDVEFNELTHDIVKACVNPLHRHLQTIYYSFETHLEENIS